ncbi:hypothetical protein [Tsuneonella sp. HG222]
MQTDPLALACVPDDTAGGTAQDALINQTFETGGAGKFDVVFTSFPEIAESEAFSDALVTNWLRREALNERSHLVEAGHVAACFRLETLTPHFQASVLKCA